MDVVKVVICVFCTLLACIGFALHSFIVKILQKSRAPHIHQKVLLTHFCCLEIASLVLHQVLMYIWNVSYPSNDLIRDIILFPIYGVSWPWVHLLIFLTLDRFLCVHLSIQYDVYVTDKKKKIVLGLCYGFGVVPLIVLILVYVFDSPS